MSVNDYPHPRIKTWADDIGRWHALVPVGMASPFIAARGAIRHELVLRSSDAELAHLSTYVRENVAQRRIQGKPGFIEFVEYQTEEDKI